VSVKLLPWGGFPGGELKAHVIGGATGYRTTNVLVHYEQMDQQFKLGTVTLIDVRCPPGGCPPLAEQIDSLFANSSEPTQTSPVSAVFARMIRAASAVPDLLSRIGLLIVLITGFITANTVAMSLSERRAELATLRAIGYTRGRIVRLLLVESILLCLIGGVLGAVVPFLLFRTQGIEMGPWALKNVTVGPAICLIGVGSSIVLGLLVAIVPAIGASRQDVVKAMAT
jgi:putative ABC transport system permease protein